MKLSGRSLWDSKWAYFEVWHSASCFTKDDARSMGFIKLSKEDKKFGESHRIALLKKLNVNGRHYETSAISISIAEQWDKEVEVKDFMI